MPSKLYINGRFLTQPLSGVQRFAEEIVMGLDRALDRDPHCTPFGRISLVVPKGPRRHVALNNIDVVERGAARGHVWDQTDLARAARDGFLLSLCNAGPVLHGQHILALHDAAVFANPQNFSARYGVWHRSLVPVLARRASALITVSKFSRQELSRHCGVPLEKFSVIQNGADHILAHEPDYSVLKKHNIEKGKFILAVGSISRNKNIDLVARALRMMPRDDLLLVVAGDNGRPFASAKTDASRNFLSIGGVTDRELRALYENALCFVFPSRYEGFGLPPLEAMLCGCTVIVSRASALPETCSDAALYCDPEDPRSLADRIQEVADQPTLRSDLRLRGRQHAGRYTWTRASSQLLDVFRQVSRAAIPAEEEPSFQLREPV